jgi:putative flavoprotein involved in K+ transport
VRATVVVIGAGQSGLAMSRCLADRSIDHVVLERNDVANSWRTERWDSLRLLTPNWQCRLPGAEYDGDDPDGFMTMPEVAGWLTEYAKAISAPVECGTTVTSVLPGSGGDG